MNDRTMPDTAPQGAAATTAALLAFLVCALAFRALPAHANDCMVLLPLFQRGLSDADIAAETQLPFAVVESCRRELSRPLPVGPAGAPPMGAPGAPPAGAAGRPPMGAAGQPPMGAAGPPPVGRDVQRLPNR
ncbi:MAG: hypothetical protein KatS3mg077_3273 [Candidatus Binatia bacterium]|nr:MAG: hypothetical protein KatS3mg077_3273 [Candidatus Binatia bacterium]